MIGRAIAFGKTFCYHKDVDQKHCQKIFRVKFFNCDRLNISVVPPIDFLNGLMFRRWKRKYIMAAWL